ncbi:ribosome assembly cofactor RimP [Mycoplasmopsis gallopavonis]|uniref:Uncharacterized BCR, YhbC family COG0779 n=1 Tax=Mycoplasmopsis gallopavonis TaxID=76629 RepID=A0A449AZ66_9BACT|nr:ribosome assembly cofactor RimP [Mycoplasmopsis gallopavonis]RIV16820.1 ribosome assembly cofactor RimP [Mycoplasmopsis gallopavonis]VEU72813.1 Uncharacterised BCR, YhbC family COG0779 [Mycoplasmopsis gallopavonis]
MDYKKILSEQFPDAILDAKLINGASPILEITVDTKDLNDVENYSRKIYAFLETQSWFKDDYALEVLSKGTDLVLDKNNLTQSLGQMIKIKTYKSFEGLNSFVAELLEDKAEEIVVKWNKKGQFRKITFNKENIESIEIYIKF